MRFTLTAGQKGDAPQAAQLIEGLPAEVVMADTAYDADHLRQAIAAKGAIAVIPNNPSRARKYPLDKPLYAERHLVECCFSKLKQFRRVATRFEKTARNYRAVVTLAAIMLWMRQVSTRPSGRTAVRPDWRCGDDFGPPAVGDSTHPRSRRSSPASSFLKTAWLAEV